MCGTPERTCIACQRKAPQSELIRISARGDAGPSVGAGPGRGAHVCSSAACIEAALKKERLARALRTRIATESLDHLRKELTCRLN